jgi:glycosyltransferase involved in cell wall biosynthesis
MKISVVIPTYNRYDFLKRAIDSVLAQTYLCDEIIVVDDGSTDNTSQIKKDTPNVTYIYQKNAGVSAARNSGINIAKNEWIAFLDSDDVWHVDKIQEQVQFHKEHQDIFISYTDESWVRDNKEVKIPKKFKKIGKDAFLENISYCNIAPSSTLVHKKLFDTYGLFDEKLEVCEDYDLWLRISLKEKIGLVNKKLIIKYAGHEDQLSFKYWGMDKFRVESLEKLINRSSIKKSTYYKNIKIELLKKYELLLKGAIKHSREEDIVKYEKKIGNFRLI